MLQSLIVGRTQEDLGIDLPSCMSAVHDLVASELVAIFLEEGRDLLYIDSVVEGSSIPDFALVGRYFALDALDQVTNCHTGWNSVRVDDDVGRDPFAAENHILKKTCNFYIKE